MEHTGMRSLAQSRHPLPAFTATMNRDDSQQIEKQGFLEGTEVVLLNEIAMLKEWWRF